MTSIINKDELPYNPQAESVKESAPKNKRKHEDGNNADSTTHAIGTEHLGAGAADQQPKTKKVKIDPERAKLMNGNGSAAAAASSVSQPSAGDADPLSAPSSYLRSSSSSSSAADKAERAASALKPKSDPSLFLKVNEAVEKSKFLYKKGNYDEALKVIHSLPKEAMLEKIVFSEIIRLLIAKGEFPKALQMITTCKPEQKSEALTSHKITLLSLLKKHEKVLLETYTYLSDFPDTRTARYYRGCALLASGDIENAEIEFQISSKTIRASIIGLAKINLNQGRLEEAYRQISAYMACNEFSHNAVIRLQQAEAIQIERQIVQALAGRQVPAKDFTIDPKSKLYNDYELACKKNNEKKYQEALVLVESILTQNKFFDNGSAILFKADLLSKLERYNDALAAYDDAMRNGFLCNGLHGKAQTYIKLNQLRKAETMLTYCLAAMERPKDIGESEASEFYYKVLSDRAEVYFNSKNYLAASKDLWEKIRLNEEVSFETRHNFAKAVLFSKNENYYEAAIQKLAKFHRYTDTCQRGNILLLRGCLSLRSNSFEQGILDLIEAAKSKGNLNNDLINEFYETLSQILRKPFSKNHSDTLLNLTKEFAGNDWTFIWPKALQHAGYQKEAFDFLNEYFKKVPKPEAQANQAAKDQYEKMLKLRADSFLTAHEHLKAKADFEELAKLNPRNQIYTDMLAFIKAVEQPVDPSAHLSPRSLCVQNHKLEAYAREASKLANRKIPVSQPSMVPLNFKREYDPEEAAFSDSDDDDDVSGMPRRHASAAVSYADTILAVSDDESEPKQGGGASASASANGVKPTDPRPRPRPAKEEGEIDSDDVEIIEKPRSVPVPASAVTAAAAVAQASSSSSISADAAGAAAAAAKDIAPSAKASSEAAAAAAAKETLLKKGRELIDKAMAAFKEENIGKAFAFFNSAISFIKNKDSALHSEALTKQALVWLFAKSHEDAYKNFTMAIQLNTNNYEARAYRAALFYFDDINGKKKEFYENDLEVLTKFSPNSLKITVEQLENFMKSTNKAYPEILYVKAQINEIINTAALDL